MKNSRLSLTNVAIFSYVIAAVFLLCAGKIAYLDGYYFTNFLTFCFLLIMLSWIVAMFLSTIMLIQNRKTTEALKISLILLVIGVAQLVTGIYLLKYHPSIESIMSRFSDRMKKEIDPLELQKWAAAKIGQTNTNSQRIPPEDLPHGLRAFPRAKCYFGPQDNGNERVLNIVLGGGFGGGGLIIGDSNLTIPSMSGIHIKKWITGVFLYED